jgi:hypothetical protein
VALVCEGEAAACVEPEERVRVFGERAARGEQEEATGHAQVRDEDVAGVHPGEDVFAAAADAFEPRSAQEARELARRVLGGEPGS